MAGDLADLVVVGAGTVGRWAAYFARLQGAERVIVIERGDGHVSPPKNPVVLAKPQR